MKTYAMIHEHNNGTSVFVFKTENDFVDGTTYSEEYDNIVNDLDILFDKLDADVEFDRNESVTFFDVPNDIPVATVPGLPMQGDVPITKTKIVITKLDDEYMWYFIYQDCEYDGTVDYSSDERGPTRYNWNQNPPKEFETFESLIDIAVGNFEAGEKTTIVGG